MSTDKLPYNVLKNQHFGKMQQGRGKLIAKELERWCQLIGRTLHVNDGEDKKEAMIYMVKWVCNKYPTFTIDKMERAIDHAIKFSKVPSYGKTMKLPDIAAVFTAFEQAYPSIAQPTDEPKLSDTEIMERNKQACKDWYSEWLAGESTRFWVWSAIYDAFVKCGYQVPSFNNYQQQAKAMMQRIQSESSKESTPTEEGSPQEVAGYTLSQYRNLNDYRQKKGIKRLGELVNDHKPANELLAAKELAIKAHFNALKGQGIEEL